VRAISEGSSSIALDNAKLLIELEQSVGLLIEPSFQGLMLSSQALVDVVNWIYIWGHWPVIGVVAIWLFARKPTAYRTYRNALIISGGIGLVFYVSFPAAPPRFTDLGLVDTVFSQSSVAQLMQPTEFTNQYAAFPSLHFGRQDSLSWARLPSLSTTPRPIQAEPERAVAAESSVGVLDLLA
jgi:hypothetical protein